MPEAVNKPVIFLAFANDRDDTVGYLRNLPDEARRLRAVLEPAEQAGLCEVVVRSNSTAADIFKVFQDRKYRNRIGIFHYGGHANGYQLLLESAAGQAASADAGGLAAFLAQQQGLQLVFLNGCSTLQQSQGLLDANVSAVISTSRSIDDRVATDFSCHFYQGLGGGAGLQKAFDEAAAAVETTQGQDTRALYLGDASKVTGTFDADRLPWLISYRDGMEHVAAWNLPNAVDDPLFGLPPLPAQDLPESPYRHLNRFTHKDADVYFGRGHQIRELYDRLTAPRTAPIMLFYGQSGVGKSSILDAGLIPRLEQDYEVRYLRRTAGGLLDTLQLAFMPEAAGVPIETAWRAKEEQTGKPLIVFLDQLEELYTRPITDLPDELHQLLEVVKATFVTADQRPRGKLVLGFRKEWLAELEAQLAASELPRSKVFLEPLDRRGIIEVVQGPARSERLRERYGLTVEDGLAEIIADDLLADRASAIAPTLQILLTKMWTKATEANYEHPLFSRDLYHDLKRDGILLRDFLNQQIAAFRERYPEVVDSGLLLDIVALHTTPLGTADQRTVEQLSEQYAHLDATLPALLQQCQDLHLLTVATSTQKESIRTTRLAHDTLAPLVREQFDESDKPGQRARRILDNRSVDWEGGRDGTPLDAADLAIVEQGARGTRALSSTEQRLLQASRELRSRLQRTRKILMVAAATAVTLIVVAAAIAVKQSVDAVVAKKKAEAALVTGKTAVDEMLLELASQGLKDVPQMESVRENLLSKASGFYQDFEKQDPGDPRWQQEVALANMHIGNMYRALGRHTDAVNAYGDSTRRFEDLMRRHPMQPEYQQGLANSYNWWGELLREQKSDKEAKGKYQQALLLQEQLVTHFTHHEDHAVYWSELARTHNNLGVLHMNADRSDEALLAFALVIAMLEPVAQASQTSEDFGPHLKTCIADISDATEVTFADYLHRLKLDGAPSPKNYRQVLAWSYGNRGIVLRFQGDRLKKETRPDEVNVDALKKYSEAEASYEKASALWIELLGNQSDERNHRLELAKSQNNLANLLLAVKRSRDALEVNEQVVKNFEHLAAATPSIRLELANSYNSRGGILWTMSRDESVNENARRQQATDAAEQYGLAYEHLRRLSGEFPENPQYWKRLEGCVCNLATLELALKEYDYLTTPPAGNPQLDDHNLALARHAKSAEALEKLDALGDRVDARRCEQAARIMSRCILLAEADPSLTQEDRNRLVDQYAKRASALLQRAIDKGADKQKLSSDVRYQPLRGVLPQAIESLKPPIAPKRG